MLDEFHNEGVQARVEVGLEEGLLEGHRVVLQLVDALERVIPNLLLLPNIHFFVMLSANVLNLKDERIQLRNIWHKFGIVNRENKRKSTVLTFVNLPQQFFHVNNLWESLQVLANALVVLAQFLVEQTARLSLPKFLAYQQVLLIGLVRTLCFAFH